MPVNYIYPFIFVMGGVFIIFIIRMLTKIFKRPSTTTVINLADDIDSQLFTEHEEEDLCSEFFENPYDEEAEIDFQLELYTQMKVYINDIQVFHSKNNQWVDLFTFPPSVRDQLLARLKPDDELSDFGSSDYIEALDGYSATLQAAQQTSEDTPEVNVDETEFKSND